MVDKGAGSPSTHRGAPPRPSLTKPHRPAAPPSDFAPVEGSSLSRLLEGHPERKVSLLEWWRWWWMRHRALRFVIEAVNGVVSGFAAGVYVYDTYISIVHVARIVYFVASWTILVEYVAKFLASNNKTRHLLWSIGLIDLATIAYGWAFFWDTEGVTNGVGFIRALRMLQVVRFMRVIVTFFFVWFKGYIQPSQLELFKTLYDVMLVIGMVIFVGGAAFYELERVDFGDEEAAPVYLHQGIYWACVTITTVGYGDFAPSNVLTQLLWPVMIGIILVIVPTKLSALTDIMGAASFYMRNSHNAFRFGEHVLLMGHTNHKTAKTFIDEFYAPDHGLQEMQLVILKPSDPSVDMRVLLSSHPASHKLTYLHGSPFVVEDLFRTDLTRAMAVFVMCNKYAHDPEEEDMHTLMIVLALSQYIRQNMDCKTPSFSIRGRGGHGKLVQGWGSETWKKEAKQWMRSPKAKDEVPHIVVQFHLPESVWRARQLLGSQAMHPLELGLLPVGSTLFPMCLGSIKHSMLGASLHTPGLLTLLSNLTMSIEISDDELPKNGGWVWEYLSGAGNEMYEVQLPVAVHGFNYEDAVAWLFNVHGVILLGLRLNMPELSELERYNIHLAPFSAEVLSLDVTTMVGIILAQDEKMQGPMPHAMPAEPMAGRGVDLHTSMVTPARHAAAANERWDSITGGGTPLMNNRGASATTAGRPLGEALESEQEDECADASELPPAHTHNMDPQPLYPASSTAAAAAATPELGAASAAGSEPGLQSEPLSAADAASLAGSGSEAQLPPSQQQRLRQRQMQAQVEAQQQQQQQQQPQQQPQRQQQDQPPQVPQVPGNELQQQPLSPQQQQLLARQQQLQQLQAQLQAYPQPGDQAPAASAQRLQLLQQLRQQLQDVRQQQQEQDARQRELARSVSQTLPLLRRPSLRAQQPQQETPHQPNQHPQQQQQPQQQPQQLPTEQVGPEDVVLEGPQLHQGFEPLQLDQSGTQPVLHPQQPQHQSHIDRVSTPSQLHNSKDAGQSKADASTSTPTSHHEPSADEPPRQQQQQQRQQPQHLDRTDSAQVEQQPPRRQQQRPQKPRVVYNNAIFLPHPADAQHDAQPPRDTAVRINANGPTLLSPLPDPRSSPSTITPSDSNNNVHDGAATDANRSKPGAEVPLKPPPPVRAKEDLQRKASKLPHSHSQISRAKVAGVSKSGSPPAVERIDLLRSWGSLSTQAAHMKRFTKSEPLRQVASCKDVPFFNQHRNIILLTGDSSFPFLQDLVAALRGGRRSQLASAIALARKMEEDAARQQHESGEEADALEQDDKHRSNSPFAQNTPHSTRWEHKHADRERELSQSPVVIMDPEGPTAGQVSSLTELDNVFLLAGNPCNAKDLGKLNLMSGSHVRALVLPSTSLLDEQAVTGSRMSDADAHTLKVCSNLRQYCNLVGANLEILTEALSFINVSYLLPLCISGPPYDMREEEDDPAHLASPTMSGPGGSYGLAASSGLGLGWQEREGSWTRAGSLPHMTRAKSAALSRAGRRTPGSPYTQKELSRAAACGMLPRSTPKKHHWKGPKPDLARSILPDLSKLTSLLPREQTNERVDEYVAQLLADLPSLAPALATGHIFTAAIMDKLFAMILFNPLLIQIITKLIGVWDCHEADEDDIDVLPTAISIMARGNKRSSSTSKQEEDGDGPGHDALLQQEVKRIQAKHQLLQQIQQEEEQEHAAAKLPASARGSSDTPRTEPRGPRFDPADLLPRIHLVQLDCMGPHILHKQQGTPQTWEALFLAWVHRKLLPIALYRRDPHTDFPYVYTCPARKAKLRDTDMVYVLAAKCDLYP